MERKIMQSDRKRKMFRTCSLLIIGIVAVAAVFAMASRTIFASRVPAKGFGSAEEAVNALYLAARAGGNDAALTEILGPQAMEIISSDDISDDTSARATFVFELEQTHRLEKRPDGDVDLLVGAENWTLPAPLMQRHGMWYFDSEAGDESLWYRRIGKDEFRAIQGCRELAKAELDYFAGNADAAEAHYAQKIFSTSGKQDGLFPPKAVDSAAGARESISGQPVPYSGYYFRILTQQGPAALGGAKNYLAGGELTGGFAVVAYPIQYSSSGVMTFMISSSGVVYEKNLGSGGAKIAGTMTAFNPDSTWEQVY
jgi:DUF2950 family protein